MYDNYKIFYTYLNLENFSLYICELLPSTNYNSYRYKRDKYTNADCNIHLCD